MDAFSSFAPHYFEYMSHCIYNDRPTTLAKIFGCFRIGYRNAQTGKQLKLDCLVTENLFHGREMTRIYDLKGSTRNRHMKETGKMNEVSLSRSCWTVFKVCFLNAEHLSFSSPSLRSCWTRIWSSKLTRILSLSENTVSAYFELLCGTTPSSFQTWTSWITLSW